MKVWVWPVVNYYSKSSLVTTVSLGNQKHLQIILKHFVKLPNSNPKQPNCKKVLKFWLYTFGVK